MTIQYLSIPVLKQALTGAWQKQLKTNRDPANGKWYTDGANHDHVGLYGGLTDSMPASPVFNTQNRVYTPQQLVCGKSTVDNRNGLAPTSTAEMSYSYTNTTSYSQTVTNGIDTSLSTTVGVNVGFVEASTTFTVSYNWSISKTSDTETSKTHTFNQSVPINVPAGKVYQAVLLASQQTLTVPYTASISVTGTTETWFEDRVNGAYNWHMPISSAFPLVNQHGTAGSNSPNFQVNNGTAAYVISGALTCVQTVNFTVQILDVTSQYNADVASIEDSSLYVVPIGGLAVPQANLVATHHFSA